jgi:hypothetical protein
MRPVLHSFAYALDYLREQVSDGEDAQMSAQPAGVVNHPAWVIGHLTFACQLRGEVAGLSPWLPENWTSRFAPGSMPVADANAYETKDELLAILRDAQAQLTAAVERFDERRLDEPFPGPSYREVFPTIRHALTQVLAGHVALHVGQVSVWRRAMGLPAMKRGFE